MANILGRLGALDISIGADVTAFSAALDEGRPQSVQVRRRPVASVPSHGVEQPGPLPQSTR